MYNARAPSRVGIFFTILTIVSLLAAIVGFGSLVADSGMDPSGGGSAQAMMIQKTAVRIILFVALIPLLLVLGTYGRSLLTSFVNGAIEFARALVDLTRILATVTVAFVLAVFAYLMRTVKSGKDPARRSAAVSRFYVAQTDDSWTLVSWYYSLRRWIDTQSRAFQSLLSRWELFRPFDLDRRNPMLA